MKSVRRLIALAAAGVMVLTLLPGTAAAAGHESIYLSLGDSVAAGTQQPLPFTSRSFTDLLFRHLEKKAGFTQHAKVACPGDDTEEMLVGTGSLCYAGGPLAGVSPHFAFGTQMASALDVIASNPGQVDLITITIGANDLLACDLDDPMVDVCVGAQLLQIGENFPEILATLMAAAPGVPIVAMNYYNPNLALHITGPAGMAAAAATQDVTAVFNGTLEGIYGLFGVPVADVETKFKTFANRGNKYPTNVRTICRLTLMCERAGPDLVLSDYDPVTAGPQPDIHPSNAGYHRIFRAFVRTMKANDIVL